MRENYHQVAGFILTGEKYPSFAIPYFRDIKSNYCIQQTKKDGSIKKKIIPSIELTKLKGLHNYSGVHYMKNTFYKDRIYVFARNKRDFCIGKSAEVSDYILKTLKKHSNLMKNYRLSTEIFKFIKEIALEENKKTSEEKSLNN